MYDCWKPTFASVRIIGGRVNASASHTTPGWVALDLRDDPLPELDRLGVRVVDPDQRDAALDPDHHHAQHLAVDAVGVVVEVQRVDVLVLLRRVLGVGDRPVGAGGEPLRVRGHPRVVGRAVQREVHRDLEAEALGPRDERVEVLEGPEVGVDRVVPAVGRPDRVRRARVARLGRERVVAALAVGLADRVQRQHVRDVEAHLGDRRQPLAPRCAGCRTSTHRWRGRGRRPPSAGRRSTRSRTAPPALHPQRERAGHGDAAADGDALQRLVHVRRGAGGEPRLRRALGVAQARHGVEQVRAVRRRRARRRGRRPRAAGRPR